MLNALRHVIELFRASIEPTLDISPGRRPRNATHCLAVSGFCLFSTLCYAGENCFADYGECNEQAGGPFISCSRACKADSSCKSDCKSDWQDALAQCDRTNNRCVREWERAHRNDTYHEPLFVPTIPRFGR
jgi:hypothetical protein